VTEATDGARLMPGHIYLAPGGDAHLEVVNDLNPTCRLVRGETVNGHRPSVDVLFNSIAKLKRPTAAAILTGMGRDGAQGLLAIREAGGRTLGQDEASCVVYGMPKAAFEIGAVEKQVTLTRMGAMILSICSAQTLIQRSA
jgi:two-component system chemotaxis response regulator CheB